MQFGKLGEMIAAHTRLKEQSRFLFIPGPDDAGIDIVDSYYSRSLFSSSCVRHNFQQFLPGPSTVLPRCALPKYLTEELQKHIPNAIFSSNPCRLTLH